MTPAQKLAKMNEVLTHMKRKNLLPQHTLGYFTQDKANLQKLVSIHDKQEFKEWSCPVCHINVYGPNKLLLEHQKIHAEKKYIREGDIYQNNYKLY